jgi:hypothetical protein
VRTAAVVDDVVCKLFSVVVVVGGGVPFVVCVVEDCVTLDGRLVAVVAVVVVVVVVIVVVVVDITVVAGHGNLLHCCSLGGLSSKGHARPPLQVTLRNWNPPLHDRVHYTQDYQ